MGKKETYIKAFREAPDPLAYLAEHSNLPGPRSNLELLYAVMEAAGEDFLLACLAYDPARAPTNTPGEFIATCGTAGLGKLITGGKTKYFSRLEQQAADPRWRVREGVAFALQAVGIADFDLLIRHMHEWQHGNCFVRRAVVAGLCEPALLKNRDHALIVLAIVENISNSIIGETNRKTEGFIALKKGLSYGLSVVMAAIPEAGKATFGRLLKTDDPDLRRILRENLRKKRLQKMDAHWVEHMQQVI